MEGVSIFLPFEFKAFDALPQGKILDKIDIIVFQLFVYLYNAISCVESKLTQNRLLLDTFQLPLLKILL